MSNLAPPPAASTPPAQATTLTLTWRHILLAVILLIDLAYAMLITAGIGLGAQERMLPPQISQLVVGGLAAATVICSGIVVSARMANRVETAVVILSGISARINDDLAQLHTLARVLRGEAAHIQAQIDRTPGSDEATVPLAATLHRNGRTYGLASVDRSHAFVGEVADMVLRKVDDRFATLRDEIQEFGNQRYFSGHAAGFEDAAGDSRGSVTALTPRNGHRTTS